MYMYSTKHYKCMLHYVYWAGADLVKIPESMYVYVYIIYFTLSLFGAIASNSSIKNNDSRSILLSFFKSCREREEVHL